MFSDKTIQLFEELLNNYQLPANHPNFTELAGLIAGAKTELSLWHSQLKDETPEKTPEKV